MFDRLVQRSPCEPERRGGEVVPRGTRFARLPSAAAPAVLAGTGIPTAATNP